MDVSQRAPRWSIGWILALTFHVIACGRSDTPTPAPTPEIITPQTTTIPRLGDLQLRDLTPPAIRPDGIADQLDQLVKDAMESEFERKRDDPSACRAAVEVGYTLLVNKQPVVSADAGEARAFFEGELVCPRAKLDEDTFRLKLDAVRSFGGTSGSDSHERLLEVLRAVLKDGAAGLLGQARMRNAPDAELRTTLATSDHPGLLAEAASEAGERKLVDVVPDLVRLSANGNKLVATRAGAALGLLGVATPEVIKALVRMTEGPEPERHLVAINSLADLGTPEAKRYLETLALGHPSATLRELARERLRGLGGEVPAEQAPEPVPEPIPY